MDFYCQKSTTIEKRDPSLHRNPIFKPEKLVVESFVNLLRLFLDRLQWGEMVYGRHCPTHRRIIGSFSGPCWTSWEMIKKEDISWFIQDQRQNYPNLNFDQSSLCAQRISPHDKLLDSCPGQPWRWRQVTPKLEIEVYHISIYYSNVVKRGKKCPKPSWQGKPLITSPPP